MRSTCSLIPIGLILLLSCNDSGTEFSPADSFAIYRLLDTTVTASSASTLPLDGLVLSPAPFITARDLSAYYWASHTFVPVPALDTVLKAMAREGGRSGGVPFVVTVGGQRVYLGTFWWAYSSSIPTVPFVELFNSQSYVIAVSPLLLGPDRRGDPRIRESLQQAGILIE